MTLSAIVVYILLLVHSSVRSLRMECFSCRSNADWFFYMERIPGLKTEFNLSIPLPVAPFECTFNPMRIYADRTAITCTGFCMKWASAKILEDGGLEVNLLRGCVESIMEPNYTPPAENRSIANYSNSVCSMQILDVASILQHFSPSIYIMSAAGFLRNCFFAIAINFGI